MEGCPADRNWFMRNLPCARPRAGYKIQSLLIGEYISWVLESSSLGYCLQAPGVNSLQVISIRIM